MLARKQKLRKDTWPQIKISMLSYFCLVFQNLVSVVAFLSFNPGIYDAIV